MGQSNVLMDHCSIKEGECRRGEKVYDTVVMVVVVVGSGDGLWCECACAR